MLSAKTNFHHSKLPKIGEIGYLSFGCGRYMDGERQRYQAVAFPLCDNVLPYSFGIHTAFFQNLKNGKIRRASGFYFNEAI
jgi:hypothetical protein